MQNEDRPLLVKKAHGSIWTRSRLLAALVAPYLIVIALGYRSWQGRLVSVGYLWALIGFLALRFAFIPSNQLVTPEAKLRQLSDNVVAAVVLCVRAAAVAAAIFAGFYFFLYLQDVYDIVKNRHVKTIVGHLTSIHYNAFTWWCLTDVWVRTDGSLQAYQLFFYPTPIQEDSDYVMHVLPRSTAILSLERCPSR